MPMFRKRWTVIRYDHKTHTHTTVGRCWTFWGADDLAWRYAAAHYRDSTDMQLTRYSWSAHRDGDTLPPYSPVAKFGPDYGNPTQMKEHGL